MGIGPFGFWEILVIAALVLLLFGPKKLPELARGLASAVREFRRGLNEASRDLQDEFQQAADADQEASQQRTTVEPAGRLPGSPAEETTHR